MCEKRKGFALFLDILINEDTEPCGDAHENHYASHDQQRREVQTHAAAPAPAPAQAPAVSARQLSDTNRAACKWFQRAPAGSGCLQCIQWIAHG